jgi:SAM-dependent methyltransferase
MSDLNAWDRLFSVASFSPRYPNEHVIRWCLRNFRRERAGEFHLLDAGCGTGRHALFMAEQGYQVSALDYSAIAIDDLRHAAQRAGRSITTAVESVDRLPFADASFDGVLSFGVLYYLSPQGFRQSLHEILRVLKPGGQALVMVKSAGDSRCTFSDSLGDGRFRIQPPPEGAGWKAEEGMELTLLTRDELVTLTRDFATVRIEQSIFTTDNGRFREEEWYLTLGRAA